MGGRARQAEVERQLVVSECERLSQFLAKQERLLPARLAELDKEMKRRREENATHLGEEISRLSALITELEGKCQQPVLELLQGVRSAVSRGKKATSPHPAPESPELEKRIRDFPRENNLQEAVTGFLEGLAAERGLRRAQGFAGNCGQFCINDSSPLPWKRFTPCSCSWHHPPVVPATWAPFWAGPQVLGDTLARPRVSSRAICAGTALAARAPSP
ncbi:E3 ubiquitin-protein ligase TRIM15-like [Chrysemys picta bellii]|uniref:E3 ubiquitin-protein ligase TRIM15-like n=1 Tax=Chrysemys picta bellii TaxID=8478 RepID=UPI0032B224BF